MDNFSLGSCPVTFQVWGVNSLVFYAEAMVAGRPLPKPYENIHDDPNQVS